MSRDGMLSSKGLILGAALGAALTFGVHQGSAQTTTDLAKKPAKKPPTVAAQLSTLNKRLASVEKKLVGVVPPVGAASGPVGPQGPQGAPGPKGDRGEQGPAASSAQLQQAAADAILTAQTLPIANVTYSFDAIRFTQGTKKLAARAYIRASGTGTWQHRIVIREAVTPTQTNPAPAVDNTPFLENSPIIFDSDVKTDANFVGSRFYRKIDTLDAYVWIAPPTGLHKFPVLRAMVGDANGVTSSSIAVLTSCAQGVIDQPYSDNLNNVTPTAGLACPFGSKITYGQAQVGLLPFKLGAGVRLAADALSVAKLCSMSGFDGAAVLANRGFSSCSDNST